MTAPSFSTFCSPLLTKLTSKVALKKYTDNSPASLEAWKKLQLFAAKREQKRVREIAQWNYIRRKTRSLKLNGY